MRNLFGTGAVATHVFVIVLPLLSNVATGAVTDLATGNCVARVNGKDVVKAVGEMWSTDDPCVKLACDNDPGSRSDSGSGSGHGTAYVKPVKEYCYLTCHNEFELQYTAGTCCGTCVQTKCKHNGTVHAIGDTWKSANGCEMFECARNMDGVAEVRSYEQSCPTVDGNCDRTANMELITVDCCVRCVKRQSSGTGEAEFGGGDDDDTDAEAYDFFGSDTYEEHPCRRDCAASNEAMTCAYTFLVEWYETLSKACYNCPANGTDCARPHCISADGVRRSVLVVNRMMPGPAVDVCLGDTIVVDVKNRLMADSTTIHWHGVHQRDTPYMDGVPHVSQCPIPPHTTFRYTFRAENAGTHFWHSHIGMQRGDGAFGALIIRDRKRLNEEPELRMYDVDDAAHTIIVQDWGHTTGVSMFASHHHSSGSNKPPNILVNGKGRIYPRFEKIAPTSAVSTTNIVSTTTTTTPTTTSAPQSVQPTTMATILDDDVELVQGDNDDATTMRLVDAETTPAVATTMRTRNYTRRIFTVLNRQRRAVETDMTLPLHVFSVRQGLRYRFRLINAEFLNCPVEVSVDGHNLTVTASDGFDIRPIEVESFVSYAGERFDFILNADQPIGNYWLRFRGLMDCDERFTSAHQVAILRYDTAPIDEPPGTPSYDFSRPGLQLNALNKGTGHTDTISIAEVDAVAADDPRLLATQPDIKFYVYYDFYGKDNPHFHVPGLYGFDQVTDRKKRLFTPQLNHISMRMPSAPLMPAKDTLDDSMFCNASSLAEQGVDCKKEFCECSHVLQVPLNAVVEMVLIDEGNTFDANHPFHLHGNAFRVVAMQRLGKNISVTEVQELDEAGKIKRRLKGAPIKDTVTIPDGGFTIIRFVADNPGYWLFHCHIEFHAEIGMALVLKVGAHNQMPSAPANFPTCSDYTPSLGDSEDNRRLKISAHSAGVARSYLTSSTTMLIMFGLAVVSALRK